MSNLSRKMMMGAAGAGGEGLGIEDVFSTWLYTGTGATQTITNGIDLAGEGGLVWIKPRNAAYSHRFYDTTRGAGYSLRSDQIAEQVYNSTDLTSFGSSGFTLGSSPNVNESGGTTFASWTFRKAPGFFDVVTYTGNGTLLTLNHNLGSLPGCIIVKRTDTTSNWPVYHRSLSADATVYLNTTGSAVTRIEEFGSVTSTTFQVGDSGGGSSQTNANGGTYVAYLFAHDEQIFGEGGDQSVIKCGSYTGNGNTTGPVVDLGWEPQWLLIKRYDSGGTGGWYLIDNMRGLVAPGGSSASLLANLANVESTTEIYPLPTGFQLGTTSLALNASGGTYIYIAIRRGPMKTPEDATTVFTQKLRTGTGADLTTTGIGFPHDAVLIANRSYAGDWKAFFDRLRGNLNWLQTYSTAVEGGTGSTEGFEFDNDTGTAFLDHSNVFNRNTYTYIDYFFRRAPGFFDVVAFLGNATSRTINHSLAVVPELMIFKCRDAAIGWGVYSAALAASENLVLQTDAAKASSATIWDNTRPTSTVFSVGSNSVSNANNGNMIAYLFATCPGISKVGTYTGSGTTKQIDCGFTAGARFVLIKRTDSTGDWYVWDTARGIVSGNDPYLLLNSTAAENTSTDYIDPLSSGFQISSSAPAAINADGGSYIFLAIA